jgi:hypothetical protein
LRYFVRTSTKLGYFLPINNFSDVELPQAAVDRAIIGSFGNTASATKSPAPT